MFPLRFLRRGIALKFYSAQITAARGVLSDAYLCDEAWQKRLEGPLLKKIRMDQYFVETDKKFGTKRLVSGVEIDMFANNVQDKSELDELEHLLYRFRRTKRATEMMDSTNYAIIRAFLKFKEYDSLMRILSNRESYGVFPDLYSYNILMSSFLKEKMYEEAARSAILMMLQEDFSNRISCVLGIYSCQMFLNNCSLSSLNPQEEEVDEENTENKAQPINEDEEEDEVKYVRVPFLRNPWFDDHFDITNPKHLIGKTFYLLAREMDNALGRSYQIVGLALYDKWDKLDNLLNTFIQSKDSIILNGAAEQLRSLIDEIPEDEDKTKDKWLNKYNVFFKKMKSEAKIQDGDLASLLESHLSNVLQSQKDDTEAQKRLFLKWEAERAAALDQQNAELDKEKRLKEIEEKQEYLYWKEKLLFFFESEDKNLEDLKKVEGLVASLKGQKEIEEAYVPPEMVKRRNEKLSKYRRLALVKKID